MEEYKDLTEEEFKQTINDVFIEKSREAHPITIHTGKGGVIDFEVAVMKCAGANEDALKRYREKLEEVLEDCLYSINTITGVTKL